MTVDRLSVGRISVSGNDVWPQIVKGCPNAPTSKLDIVSACRSATRDLQRGKNPEIQTVVEHKRDKNGTDASLPVKWTASQIFPSRWRGTLVLVALLSFAPVAMAQQVPPHVGYVFPAGGRQGTTVEVTVGGQYLGDVVKAYISGDGAKIAIVPHEKPMTRQQFNQLRDKAAELRKKLPDPEVRKQLVEIRKQLATFLRRPSSPVIAESVPLQITLAADAAPGPREVRLETPTGLSNPLVFNVGQLPESVKQTPTDTEDLAELRALRAGAPPPGLAAAPPMSVTLPVTVNGQILPSGADRFRFAAVKGQHVVMAVQARELIPYIADAVPGWFQAAITLRDGDGHEVAFADHFRFHPDPVLCCEIPRDGPYDLEIRDSICRGREDFVYRVTMGELPFITDVFPLGCKAGGGAAVELAGWNLPATKLTWDAKDKTPGVYALGLPSSAAGSNAVPFAVDSLPEVLERKPNDSRTTAQALKLPVIVNGRVERAGQWSVFRFDGRSGDEIVAEVIARRLGSPLDSVLRLTDASGRQLAFNDDYDDKSCGLETHHADSYIRIKLPADGMYYLELGDIQHQGGPECAYRLRISSPRPDYELRIAPSAINLRGGATMPATVFAVRKDGFAGEISLSLKNAPEGFVLDGGKVPAGQDSVRVTLTAPAAAPNDPVPLALEGRATIQGRQVIRKAVPAENMMQAFAYWHLVPAQELAADVSSRKGLRRALTLLSSTPVRIVAGRTVSIRVGVPQETQFGTISFELNEPPEGLSIQGLSEVGRGTEIVLKSDPAKLKAPLAGNLIVNVFLTPKNPPPRVAAQTALAAPSTTQSATAATTAPAKPQNNPPRRVWVGTLPAIPFEVVGGQRS